MRTIIKSSNREEWLHNRTTGIGSSEVATILGLNPFETPYQLWMRKLGKLPPKQENFAMKAGHFLEDAVSLFFADATGAQVIKASVGDWIIRDSEKPYLQVSPDRTFWRAGDKHNEANKGILECKTTKKTIDEANVPDHWFIQLMYQLGVAGYDHGALAWLNAGQDDFGYFNVEFNEEAFKALVGAVDDFWNINIVGGVEPALIDFNDVLLKFPKEVAGKSLEATADIAAAVARLKEINEQKKDIDAEKAKLEDTIKLAMLDNEILLDATGGKLATWKANKDGMKFNEKLFAAEHPDLYDHYKEIKAGARVLRIK